MRRLLPLMSLALACGRPNAPLAPAGHAHDEGHGELARASRALRTADETNGVDPFADERDARERSPGYGGSTYGAYESPSWSTPPVDRDAKYDELENLAAAIEGTVTWRGPVPAASMKTACGDVPANLRLGSQNTLGGVLVFIARVQQGRILPMDNRPATVGGIVTKRGCAFLPTAQLVTPHPAPLVIHGDATATRVRIAAREPAPLQAGGRIALRAPLGTTRIDATDGAHAAAWVVATESPAYAITDDRGRYRIDELAPGTYEVTFWQAPLATVTNGSLVYGTPIITKRTVRVHGRRTARLDVTLAR